MRVTAKLSLYSDYDTFPAHANTHTHSQFNGYFTSHLLNRCPTKVQQNCVLQADASQSSIAAAAILVLGVNANMNWICTVQMTAMIIYEAFHFRISHRTQPGQSSRVSFCYTPSISVVNILCHMCGFQFLLVILLPAPASLLAQSVQISSRNCPDTVNVTP